MRKIREIVERTKRNIRYGIFLGIFSLTLLSCGEAQEQSGTEQGKSPSSDIMAELESRYQISEIAMLEANRSLLDSMEEGEYVQGGQYCIDGDTVYHIAPVRKQMGEIVVNYNSYLQILRSPYEEWENYDLQLENYAQDEEGSRYYIVAELAEFVGVAEDCVYLQFQKATTEGMKPCIGVWTAEEGLVPLFEEVKTIEGWSDANWFVEKEAIYQYVQGQKYYYKYSFADKGVEKVHTDNTIYNIFENPSDGQVWYYGKGTDSMGLFALQTEECIRTLDGEAPSMDELFCFKTLYTPDDLLLNFTDSQMKVADVKEDRAEGTGTKTPQQVVCSFVQSGYQVNEIHGVESRGEEVLMLVSMTEGDVLLSLQKGVAEEKQELTAVSYFTDASLAYVIRLFNRENPDYHVTLLTAENVLKDDGMNYKDWIQRELSGGGGPDLLHGDWLDEASGYISNGYFEELNDLSISDEAYYPQIKETGRYKGLQYGIPLVWRMDYMSCSKELVGDRTSWTLPEFMETVRSSETSILQMHLSGEEIVIWFGLMDEQNNAYIDWENGESNLTEAPFIELLEFAREYVATQEENQQAISGDGKIEYYPQGKVAVYYTQLWDPREVNRAEAIFGKQVSNIGYPREDGNGIYAAATNLYLNVNSKQKDGAKQFLEFMISKDVQQKLAKHMAEQVSPEGGECRGLPIRADVMEEFIQRCKENAVFSPYKLKQNGSAYFINDIRFDPFEFTEEDEKQFCFLVENARPHAERWSDIAAILSEELQPYFLDQRSAEETVRILDNRVQLYLDEVH